MTGRQYRNGFVFVTESVPKVEVQHEIGRTITIESTTTIEHCIGKMVDGEFVPNERYQELKDKGLLD